jgi:hypothetical protein
MQNLAFEPSQDWPNQDWADVPHLIRAGKILGEP